MTRLVNAMREQIVENMTRHAFADRVAALVTQQATLAAQIYNDTFDAAVRKRIDGLPDGWLPMDDDIKCAFGSDMMFVFKFNGAFSTYGTHRELAFLSNSGNPIWRRFTTDTKGTCCIRYDDGSVMSDQLNQWLERVELLAEEIQASRRKLQTALNSYHTTEKLVEAWPEIAPFVVPLAPVEAPNLPALPTQDLNALFGLPVSAQ